MGQRWDLSTEEYWTNFQAFRSQALLAGKKVIVELIPEHRSLNQNDMIHALYRQIAGQKEDESITDITRYCKLHHGVPILRSDNQQFARLYDKAVKPVLTYEEKLEAMDILPVTSLMGKKQATEYIDAVIREFTQQGLCLTHPGEENH